MARIITWVIKLADSAWLHLCVWLCAGFFVSWKKPTTDSQKSMLFFTLLSIIYYANVTAAIHVYRVQIHWLCAKKGQKHLRQSTFFFLCSRLLLPNDILYHCLRIKQEFIVFSEPPHWIHKIFIVHFLIDLWSNAVKANLRKVSVSKLCDFFSTARADVKISSARFLLILCLYVGSDEAGKNLKEELYLLFPLWKYRGRLHIRMCPIFDLSGQIWIVVSFTHHC